MLTWAGIFTAIDEALADLHDMPRRRLAVTMLKKIVQQLRQANRFTVRTGISQEEKANELRQFILQHHATVGPILTLQITVWEPDNYVRLFGDEMAGWLTQLHHARHLQPDPALWTAIPADENQEDQHNNGAPQVVDDAAEDAQANEDALEIPQNGHGGLDRLRQGLFNRGTEEALQQRLLAALDRGENGRNIIQQLFEQGEAQRARQHDIADADISVLTNNGVETYVNSQITVQPQPGLAQFGTPVRPAQHPNLVTPGTHHGGNAGGYGGITGGYAAPITYGKHKILYELCFSISCSIFIPHLLMIVNLYFHAFILSSTRQQSINMISRSRLWPKKR